MITSLYASFLALLFVGLSVRTLRLRRRLKISIGDGGNQMMLRAMRVHSNFAEYVPMSLLMIFLVENQGAIPFFIHFLGAILLLGRASHAYGISQEKEDFRFRVFGMALTFTTLISCAITLLVGSLLSL